MFPSGLNGEHALQALGTALRKEEEQWKPVFQRTGNGKEISDVERDKTARWLVQLSQTFDFAPETYVLAIALTDRVAQHVKIRPKYLQCVAISCLYIAAKTLEDDEAIPITVDLVEKSQCGCSVSEVLRMELVILNTLKWNVKIVTVIDFLHLACHSLAKTMQNVALYLVLHKHLLVDAAKRLAPEIHTLLMWRFPHLLAGLKDMSLSRHLALLTRKLMTCLGHSALAYERPSVLALSLVSLELEQISQHWLSVLIVLQTVAKVENNQLISCRERMAWILSQHCQLMSGYQLKSTRIMKSKKRKVDPSESDNIYDGIKRLYEDCGGSADKCTLTKRGSCASEMHQEMDDHIFIQTVAAV